MKYDEIIKAAELSNEDYWYGWNDRAMKSTNPIYVDGFISGVYWALDKEKEETK